jgi:hypothetical protein
MSTKNSRTLTLEEVKEQYGIIQEKELRSDEFVKVKGEDIQVQDIVANLCWMLYSGETTAEFECCKPGCVNYPCQ